MFSVEQAKNRILEGMVPVAEIEEVATLYSFGRILASDIRSTIQVPPLDNSQMDGYAVRCEDFSDINQVFCVSDRIQAGYLGRVLEPKTCARIYTGAPIPRGADAVIPQEDAEVLKTGEVRFNKMPIRGNWIRKAGSDIQINDVVARKGTRITPAMMGVIASIGISSVNVYKPIRVALFFTGDELSMPGESLVPGGIYNSNRFTLRGLLQGLGCDVVDYGNIPDTLERTIEAFTEASCNADLILTSGGMSVGDADFIKTAVESLGKIDVWRVAVKPGKPVAKGVVKGVPFIGLPGNPVSALVTFLLFAQPLILKLSGRTDFEVKSYQLPLSFDWEGGSRQEFIRVKRNKSGALECFRSQNSAVLTSCLWADGLADIPAGVSLKKGDYVTYIPFVEFCK